MRNALFGFIAILLIGLVSIVPWTEAAPKPQSVLIWCQDSTGAQAPCVGGTQMDYDTTGATSNVGVIGIVIPSASGPVAAGTSTNPFVVSVNNATLAVTQSGSWSLAANQSVNVSQINGVTPLMGAGNTGTGSPRVTIATDQAALVGLGVYVEDAAETAGGNLAMSGTVRRDTAASSAGASGDNATLNTDGNGLLWARLADPCAALTKTYLPINISTATTTEITPSLAGASNHYYVCSINIGPVAGAQNLALVDDDTDNCASVTSGLAGGTTAGSGWNIAANGGLTMGNGLGSIARTGGTNRVLCLVSSAAVQTSGVMTVVAAP